MSTTGLKNTRKGIRSGFYGLQGRNEMAIQSKDKHSHSHLNQKFLHLLLLFSGVVFGHAEAVSE